MTAVRAARIGLYRSWVASIDEGWIRWLFEQYGFGYTTLREPGHSRRQSAPAVRRRHAAGAVRRADSRRPQRGSRRRGMARPDPCRRSIVAGIGAEGIAALGVRRGGGRLVAFEGASELVLDSFGGVFARIRNPLAELDQATFYCPGSVLRIDVDHDASRARTACRRRPRRTSPSRAHSRPHDTSVATHGALRVSREVADERVAARGRSPRRTAGGAGRAVRQGT